MVYKFLYFMASFCTNYFVHICHTAPASLTEQTSTSLVCLNILSLALRLVLVLEIIGSIGIKTALFCLVYIKISAAESRSLRMQQ